MRTAHPAKVWSVALDVWGDEAEARDFLFRPHAMLEDKRPIDVIVQSEPRGRVGDRPFDEAEVRKRGVTAQVPRRTSNCWRMGSGPFGEI